MILYILLSGVPPFWGETEQQIFEAVGKGHIDFKTDPWPHISSEAKDCVRRMLQPVRVAAAAPFCTTSEGAAHVLAGSRSQAPCGGASGVAKMCLSVHPSDNMVVSQQRVSAAPFRTCHWCSSAACVRCPAGKATRAPLLHCAGPQEKDAIL